MPLPSPLGTATAACDTAAAYAAADACRSLAAVLVMANDARAIEAERAVAEWLGPSRDLFVQRLGALQAEAEHLVVSLRRAAASIERAVWLAEVAHPSP